MCFYFRTAGELRLSHAAMDVTIGVDFGTTKTVLAIDDIELNKVKVVPNDSGALSTPSCASWSQGQIHDVLFGDAALCQAEAEPWCVLTEFKQCLGTSVGGALPIRSEELSAMFLGEMKRVAENWCKNDIKKAVIAVPSYFSSSRRRAVMDSACLAGFQEVRLVNDTSAVLLTHARKMRNKAVRHTLIVDVGAGGGSVSVARMSKKDVYILAASESRLPGGHDFDDHMTDYLLKVVHSEHNILIQDHDAVQMLRRQWKAAKENLSRMENSTVTTCFPGVGEVTLKVDRVTFENQCNALFQEILDQIPVVLARARLQTDKVFDIILEGASCQIPYLRQSIQKLLQGKPLARGISAGEAVALGAAMHGEEYVRLHEVICKEIVVTFDGLRVTIPSGTSLPHEKRDVCKPCKAARVTEGSGNGNLILYMKRIDRNCTATGYRVCQSGIFSLLSHAGKPLLGANLVGCMEEIEKFKVEAKMENWRQHKLCEAQRNAEKIRYEKKCKAIAQYPKESPLLGIVQEHLHWLECNPRASIEEYRERRLHLKHLQYPGFTDDESCSATDSDEYFDKMEKNDESQRKKQSSNTSSRKFLKTNTSHGMKSTDLVQADDVKCESKVERKCDNAQENVPQLESSEKPPKGISTDGKVSGKVETRSQSSCTATDNTCSVKQPLITKLAISPPPNIPLDQRTQSQASFTATYNTCSAKEAPITEPAISPPPNIALDPRTQSQAQACFTATENPCSAKKPPIRELSMSPPPCTPLDLRTRPSDDGNKSFTMPQSDFCTRGSTASQFLQPTGQSAYLPWTGHFRPHWSVYRGCDLYMKSLCDAKEFEVASTPPLARGMAQELPDLEEPDVPLAAVTPVIVKSEVTPAAVITGGVKVVLDALSNGATGEEISPVTVKRELEDQALSEVSDAEVPDDEDEGTVDVSHKKFMQYTLDDVAKFLQSVENKEKLKCYPPSCKDKSNFRRRAQQSFRLQDGKLYHKTHCGKKTHHGRDNRTFPEYVRVITNRKRQLYYVQLAHEGTKDSVQSESLSAHRGIKATEDILSRRVWWPNQSKDVTEYITSCESCQKVRRAVLKARDPLKPIPPPHDKIRQIGIDLIKMPESCGFSYAVIAIDYLSKFCHGKPLRTKKASEVALFIFEWISLFGCPKIIINDQGREFCNAVVDELQKLTGIRQRVTRAYNPQADGLVERQNGSIKCALLKVVLKDPSKWSSALDGVMFAHRTQKQRSTNYSPFFLMFGQEPMLPLDVALLEPEEDVESCDEDDPPEVTWETFINQHSKGEEGQYSDYEDTLIKVVQNHENMKNQVLSKARDNIKKAQEIQKEDYDKRHCTAPVLKVGDKVWKRNLRRDERKGDWQLHPYLGPYKIESVSNGIYTLKNLQTGRVLKQTCKSQHLKAYIDRPDNVNIDKVADERPQRKNQDDCLTSNLPDTVVLEDEKDDVSVVHKAPYLNEPRLVPYEEMGTILSLPHDTPVVSLAGYTITVKELRILNTQDWLNDEIINFSLKLLMKEFDDIYAFSTFFYTKLISISDEALRWIKNVNVFEKRLLLVPIHLVNHWILCAVDVKTKAITFYNSMAGSNDACLKPLLSFLRAAWLEKSTEPFPHWNIHQYKRTEMQKNAFDCGVYVYYFARQLCRRKTCDDSAATVERFRSHMVQEICSCSLIQCAFEGENYSFEGLHRPPLVMYDPLGTKSVTLKVGRGIRNTGNTCFINATVQVLFHCQHFAAWLLEDTKHQGGCTKDCLQCALARMLIKCQEGGKDAVEPTGIVKMLQGSWKGYHPGNEEDAREFLAWVLQTLSSEFLLRSSHAVIDIHSRNTTPSDSIFGGYWRTEASCLNCGAVSTTFAHFTYLSIYGNSVNVGLEDWAKREDVPEARCDSCHEKGMTKQMWLETCPRVLVLHLQRNVDEMEGPCSTPRELNLKSYDEHPHQYRCTGMVEHQGAGTSTPHYVAHVLAHRSTYTFNDSLVTRISAGKMWKKRPHICAYEQV